MNIKTDETTAKNSPSIQELIGASQRSQNILFFALFFSFSVVLSVIAVANIDLMKVLHNFFSVASSESIFFALGVKFLYLLEFLIYACLILIVAYNLASMCFFISNYAVVNLLKAYLFQDIESSDFVNRAAEFFAFSRLNNKCVSISKVKGEFVVDVHCSRTSEDNKVNFASENPLFNLDPSRMSSNWWVAYFYIITTSVLAFLVHKLGTSTTDSKVCLVAFMLILPSLTCVWVRGRYVSLAKQVCEKLVALASEKEETAISLHKALASLDSANSSPLPKNTLDKKMKFCDFESIAIMAATCTVLTGLLATLSDPAQLQYEFNAENTQAVNLVANAAIKEEPKHLKFKLASTEANSMYMKKLTSRFCEVNTSKDKPNCSIDYISSKECGVTEKAVVLNKLTYCMPSKTPEGFIQDVQNLINLSVKKD